MISVEQREREKIAIPGVVQLLGGKMCRVDSLVGFPPRVAARVLLHQHDFVRMFTGIIGPEESWGLDELRMIGNEAKRSNKKIGLRSSKDDVVLRTRDVHTTIRGGKLEDPMVRVTGTNTMLLINGISHAFPNFMSISGADNTVETWPTLSLWKDFRIVGRNYFLVHQEDNVSQKEAIHGRIGWLNDGSCEISLGDNVLHARMIGDNGSTFVRMAGHDLSMMLEMVAEGRGRIVDRDGKGIGLLSGLRSNNWERADKLAADMLPWIGELERLKTEMVPMINNSVVFEFRLYRGSHAVAGLNVYDFDYRWGRGGVDTISGLRPDAAYEGEMARERRLAA